MIRAALFRLPIARVRRFRRGILPIAGWTLLGVLGARLIAVAGAESGELTGRGVADEVTLTWLAALVVPFLAYATTSAALGKRRLDDAAAPLVGFGASRRDAALAYVVAVAAMSAFFAAFATFLALGSIHAVSSDIFTSTWAAALAGAAYGALFTVGACFGRSGGGRTFVLVVDLIVGSSNGAVALFTPRGHLRNLLGGVAPHDIGQRSSCVVLAVMTALACTWIALRGRRAPKIYAL